MNEYTLNELKVPDLRGKVALVTGASLGIGAAVARAFGAQGMKVAVHYNRSEGPAAEVGAAIRASGGEAMLVSADVRDGAAIRRSVAQVLQKFGRIDVLVNNAGSLVKRVQLAEQSDEFFDEVMHVNARSVVAFAREVVTSMRQHGGGTIINVTSAAARNGGGPGSLLYAGSKGFISTVTRALARELVADHIRVNAVAPGVILTPLQDQFSTPAMLEAFKASIPMGRLGTPEECVGAFLYLASDLMSGYVTGQTLEVNGGQLMP
ncbi:MULTISPECIES: glucose 1-dehydrogenase [unclassified Polaromonas]|jgi:3-oxoacyl-[acyl-carrier protein] reductase|uniref:SDR family NAD(P)-dependent oxidoreductase n=1 Tax=unclassified Polaromonas TaxID=2638319 RepID=UPI000BC4E494|nr:MULTISPECIES: glucose 1-dehydrogenase [unclassified Polaromonas]OYY32928.1 MAG: oxidoreductase [Polaromonas sp. 35-63-35]OYZ16345.1 MAG: oxidoreductase [Polaromonas sp. 16-63-31]OYZ76400.1 MAG: oxidoreductase [Polaromonas sp. 24-63-21]OZA48953.1 MAG: oxidoreductase [Polaromonas sp. 17-63-33]OZA85618.1 MAG: oxidoreductase [Polaromonas sp. 39-63-25]